MQTTISKLTSKFQATIPSAVRKALDLRAGDAIAFDVEKGGIRVRKAGKIDIQWAGALEGTLNEWNSEEDDEAYGDL